MRILVSLHEEIIKDNLDYNILCQDPKFDFLRSFLTSNLYQPFLSAKRALDLVRENQQSSAHNFVKDFSSFFPESRRRSPLKKGAVTEIPLEYGKTEVQIPFEPLESGH